MHCPYCGHSDDKVIDSRSTESGKVIRRRRQCLSCHKRYTTYERVEQAARLMVVKRDGTRVPFNPENVAKSVSAAIGKRPVSEASKQRLVEEIEEELHAEFDREVPSQTIGERVMARLRAVDPVAYVRFASEHLRFSTLMEIRRELDDLMSRPAEAREQQPLFASPGGGGPGSAGGAGSGASGSSGTRGRAE